MVDAKNMSSLRKGCWVCVSCQVSLVTSAVRRGEGDGWEGEMEGKRKEEEAEIDM